MLRYAEAQGVAIALEPEPGMVIDTTAAFYALHESLRPLELKITLDIGHLMCQGESPLAEYITAAAGRLVNVHLDDMRRLLGLLPKGGA